MFLAIGAATADPLPPLSIITATTISGLSNGAKLINKAWSCKDFVPVFPLSKLYTCAVPVFPAYSIPSIFLT